MYANFLCCSEVSGKGFKSGCSETESTNLFKLAFNDLAQLILPVNEKAHSYKTRKFSKKKENKAINVGFSRGIRGIISHQ